MGIESVAGIWDLNELWPLATDSAATSDDHHRLSKNALELTFPEISSTVNISEVELNYLDGVDADLHPQLSAIAVSISAGNESISQYSLSLSSINNSIEDNNISICALHSIMINVYTEYDIFVAYDGDLIYGPANWVVTTSTTGIYRITHGHDYEDETSVNYIVTCIETVPRWALVSWARNHINVITFDQSTSLAASGFYLKMTDVRLPWFESKEF